MSALGFEVHVDKENATHAPFANKAGAVKHFGVSRDKGKLLQPTPRKALFDVNHEPASRGIGAGNKELGSVSNVSRDGLFKPVKPSTNSFNGVENAPLGSHIRKQQESKRTLSAQKKNITVVKAAELHTSKPKSTKPKKKPPPIPNPGPEFNDDDYDSDTIFPRTERLSSYVDKLLAWRPPCLFGSIPDSESDNTDSEELPHDDIIGEMPLCLTTVPEYSDSDLASLMGEMPLPIPEDEDQAAGNTELSLDQTIDTSISLGSLHVMTGSLHVSGLNLSNDLEHSTSQK